jgi:hypothetical protein
LKTELSYTITAELLIPPTQYIFSTWETFAQSGDHARCSGNKGNYHYKMCLRFAPDLEDEIFGCTTHHAAQAEERQMMGRFRSPGILDFRRQNEQRATVRL